MRAVAPIDRSGVMIKLCPLCGEPRPIGEFCRDRSSEDGFHQYCHTHRRRQTQQRYRLSHRQQVVAARKECSMQFGLTDSFPAHCLPSA